MTYADILTEVVDRLGVTDARGYSRIGRAINIRYRDICSTVGLETTGRATVTAATVIGTRTLSFTGQKIYLVYDANVTPANVLNEISMDQMRNQALIGTEPSWRYAIQDAGASTVTILLDATPTSVYTYTADVQASNSVLTATSIPAFPANFHDILIEGAMEMELRHRGDYNKADVHMDAYARRLSELRFFLAKSAYLSRYQSKTAGWGWPSSWTY